MGGDQILAIMLASGSGIFLGWGFLYREPQYTIFSWLVLGTLISDALIIGGLLLI